MKRRGWYFLVVMCSLVLITTFFTRNTYVAIGTFLVVMYLQKLVKSKRVDIPDPRKQFLHKSEVTPSRESKDK